MNIVVPDPHPGRCRNLRPSRYYSGTFLRCLDYEGTEHQCSFDVERIPASNPGWNSATYTHTEPKPWVKP